MAKHISDAIRKRALVLFQDRHRSQQVSTLLRVYESTLSNWQEAFDRKDFSWTSAKMLIATKDQVLLAVELYARRIQNPC